MKIKRSPNIEAPRRSAPRTKSRFVRRARENENMFGGWSRAPTVFSRYHGAVRRALLLIALASRFGPAAAERAAGLHPVPATTAASSRAQLSTISGKTADPNPAVAVERPAGCGRCRRLRRVQSANARFAPRFATQRFGQYDRDSASLPSHPRPRRILGLDHG